MRPPKDPARAAVKAAAGAEEPKIEAASVATPPLSEDGQSALGALMSAYGEDSTEAMDVADPTDPADAHDAAEGARTAQAPGAGSGSLEAGVMLEHAGGATQHPDAGSGGLQNGVKSEQPAVSTNEQHHHRRLCRYYTRGKKCFKGDQCTFLHCDEAKANHHARAKRGGNSRKRSRYGGLRPPELVPSLYDKLVADQRRQRVDKILQCLRFLVRTEFLTKPTAAAAPPKPQVQDAPPAVPMGWIPPADKKSQDQQRQHVEGFSPS